MTRVSIITPSYNQAKFLEQTILSVLNQDYPDIEYIVMDGGSTDGSVEIIKKYTVESNGLPFGRKIDNWISEKDAGQADAINKGFARASGDLVAWLNSDDFYHPEALRSAVQVFDENPDVVLVYGNMLAVDENGATFNTLNYKQLTLEDLLCFQIVGQPAVFMRRSALQKTNGLNLDFHFLLDHLLWIQIAQHGKILHVNQTWASARYHAEAKNVAKAAEFGREAFRILETVAQDENLAAHAGESPPPRPRLCPPRGCTLLARWRTSRQGARRMDARLVPPSTRRLGANEYFRFECFEFVGVGKITRKSFETTRSEIQKVTAI
jgi:hypothetical protein